MGNRLSHSSTSRYQTCPTSFKYHYIDRLRSTTMSSALFFGTAVDNAITAMIKNEDAELTFKSFWEFQDVNGSREYLPTSTSIVYANSDVDSDLLLEQDYEEIARILEFSGDIASEIDEVYKEKEYLGFDNLPHDRKVFLNVYNWFCLYRKGLIMIKTFRKEILPNITEVLGSQVPVKLDNGAGDLITGFADFVVRWQDDPTPIIFDLKTSSRDYDEKMSVITSAQLTLYVHALSEQFENTRRAGYIVLNKHIRKNKTKICSVCGNDGSGARHKTCAAEIVQPTSAGTTAGSTRCNGAWKETFKPEAKFQVIIDEIPLQTENIVIENMGVINEAISTGVFHRNLGSCIQPWGPCTFFDLCYKNDSRGLVKAEEKKS